MPKRRLLRADAVDKVAGERAVWWLGPMLSANARLVFHLWASGLWTVAVDALALTR